MSTEFQLKNLNIVNWRRQMILIMKDCDNHTVLIRAEELGEFLLQLYEDDYDGEDGIKNFIDWFKFGCQDNEEE